MYVCMCACLCKCVCVCVCVSVCLSDCMYVCIYVCMCACLCKWVYLPFSQILDNYSTVSVFLVPSCVNWDNSQLPFVPMQYINNVYSHSLCLYSRYLFNNKIAFLSDSALIGLSALEQL